MRRLNELTIREAVEGLKSGSFSSVDLIQACLDQVAALDGELRAFVTVLESQSKDQAALADKIIAHKGPALLLSNRFWVFLTRARIIFLPKG